MAKKTRMSLTEAEAQIVQEFRTLATHHGTENLDVLMFRAERYQTAQLMKDLMFMAMDAEKASYPGMVTGFVLKVADSTPQRAEQFQWIVAAIRRAFTHDDPETPLFPQLDASSIIQ